MEVLKHDPVLCAGRTNRPLRPADIFAETHPGLVRTCNEDSFGVSVGEANTFIAVADGIGGHDCGDVASQTCIRSLLSAWRLYLYGKWVSVDTARRFLSLQIQLANEKIFKINETQHQRNPMGTTLVAACFLENSVVLAHLGDSRCYRVRNGRIRQMTHDHSYVSELVSSMVLSPQEALNHPFSHVICRSVGIMPVAETELNIFDRRPGDRFLFCTDGAIVDIDETEIEGILYDAQTPSEAANSLMRHALQSGGEDNITLVAIFS